MSDDGKSWSHGWFGFASCGWKQMHKHISLIYGVFFMGVNPMGSNPQKKSPNKQSKLLDIHDIHLYNIVYNYTKPKHSMLCAIWLYVP